MKLYDPRLWLGSFSAAIVVLLAVRDLERVSPGDLAAVHQSVPELIGRGSCHECHGRGDDHLAGSCIECHKDVGQSIDARDGLHGALEGPIAMECALCHSDHHGSDFRLVNARSFLAAGVPDVEALDHEKVGFAMGGGHLELDCAECHTQAYVQVLLEGQKRFMGLDRDCASCHDDAHEGRMVLDCASCHDQVDFAHPGAFVHDDGFPDEGKHGEADCRECHAENGAYALERLVGKGRKPQSRICLDCHESPHRNFFLRSVAQIVAKAPGESCGSCHDAGQDVFRGPGTTITPVLHACSGFTLEPPHDQANCQACHPAEMERFRRRYPGREADDCIQCHADPHGGQFETGPFAGAGCLACHDRHQFEPHAFGLEEHEQTALPLEGVHADTECSACHVDPVTLEGLPEKPRVFRGTASTCESCHEDAHEGFFDAVAVPLEKGGKGTCASCHTPESFDAVAHESFDHELWTGFPILGAHAETRCEECHPRTYPPDEKGRSFGRVAEHFGVVKGCETCHDSPHEGRFTGKGFPARVDGKSGCARCHDETSFRYFEDGFDHERWTGFPIRGPHKRAGCSACHAPLIEPDQLGRTWGTAAGTRCADCHDDPHVGQFEFEGDTSCDRCHTSATEFSDLEFKHRNSRFRLGPAHVVLECSVCHLPEPVPDGSGEFIRYRPLGRRCVDCHDKRGGQLGTRGGK